MLDYETAPMVSTGVAAPQAVTNSGSYGSVVIDGTPVRVAGLVLGSVAGLMLLRWAGFKFNVTASV